MTQELERDFWDLYKVKPSVAIIAGYFSDQKNIPN